MIVLADTLDSFVNWCDAIHAIHVGRRRRVPRVDSFSCAVLIIPFPFLVWRSPPSLSVFGVGHDAEPTA